MSQKKFSSAQQTPGKAGPGDKFRDAPVAELELPVARDVSEKTPKVTTESSREDADRQAMERGEEDGMIVHQSATSSAHNRRDFNAITEG
ncbi:MAG: hypothetical protein ABF290_00555 [Thiogranum sp.]